VGFLNLFIISKLVNVSKIDLTNQPSQGLFADRSVLYYKVSLPQMYSFFLSWCVYIKFIFLKDTFRIRNC